jgi:hypothetical protein
MKEIPNPDDEAMFWYKIKSGKKVYLYGVLQTCCPYLIQISIKNRD